jgi:N-acetylglucosamine kinase-like BadF-type ATPase
VILIAESGSAKAQWCLVEKGFMVECCESEGINPFFQTRKQVSHLIRENLPSVFFKSKLDTLYFYGTGCAADERKAIVKASLESQFKARAQIESDSYGAARALFQRNAGIACVLDTDSNSCLYNGIDIIKKVRPLGYILGDEGSSASLGKTFLADCLKKLAPEIIMKAFYSHYGITADELLDLIYTQPFPNRFLSKISFFLYDHLYHPYVYGLVYDNLKSFFVRNVFQYDYANYNVRFIGTVADTYSDLLMQIAMELRVQIDMIVKSPMKGLIQYHADNS